jgi:hypothetical protein
LRLLLLLFGKDFESFAVAPVAIFAVALRGVTNHVAPKLSEIKHKDRATIVVA